MKLKTLITLAAVLLAALSFAKDDVRIDLRGAISWESYDRDGNHMGIVFDFGRGGVGVYGHYSKNDNRRYRKDRYRGRYEPYRNRPCPPVYRYDRYNDRYYDSRYFRDYEEWSDWREWQGEWDDDRDWYEDDRERERSWDRFQEERYRAEDQYYSEQKTRWGYDRYGRLAPLFDRMNRDRDYRDNRGDYDRRTREREDYNRDRSREDRNDQGDYDRDSEEAYQEWLRERERAARERSKKSSDN